MSTAAFEIEPFQVAIAQPVLDDLRLRLGRTRWPDQVAGAGWAYGANLEFMQEIAGYWASGFDWLSIESHINTFANFRATVDGTGIHFIHERGQGPNPLPLLITHGWPSSFYEMLELISLLVDPASHGGDAADAFDVVVPAVPGYPFSDRPSEPGFDYRKISRLWIRLMAGLGYGTFGAHAYDIGASIMTHMLLDHPERLIGYHTTEPENPSPYLGPGSDPLTDAEQAFIALQEAWRIEEGGYSAIQTTRPQSLGYALNDSPVGMAAWILEKWHVWTAPPSGNLLDHFTMDQLLATVTLHWVAETMNSANRLYYERFHHTRTRLPEDRIDVPFGVALTATQPNERPPREHVERLFTGIRHWVNLGRGGHFIAMEEPQLVADSIRTFFRPLR